MWKKAHLKLAEYLVECNAIPDFKRYERAFCVGSVLPDCMPSFITKRHRIADTYDVFNRELQKVNQHSKIDTYLCLHLGIIIHYVADYFTFPHNDIFTGSLAAHCFWERRQQEEIGRRFRQAQKGSYISVNSLRNMVDREHDEYLKHTMSIQNDCDFIVKLCQSVTLSVLRCKEISQKNSSKNSESVQYRTPEIIQD